MRVKIEYEPDNKIFLFCILRYTVKNHYRYKAIVCEMKSTSPNYYFAKPRITLYNYKHKATLVNIIQKWNPDSIYYKELKPNYFYNATVLKLLGADI